MGENLYMELTCKFVQIVYSKHLVIQIQFYRVFQIVYYTGSREPRPPLPEHAAAQELDGIEVVALLTHHGAANAPLQYRQVLE